MRICIGLLLLLTTVMFPRRTTAQESEAARDASGPGSVLTIDLPQDISEEWRLTTWNNRTVVADRQSIRLDGKDIRMVGSLKSMSMPCADVASITVFPVRNAFRNGLVAGAFLSSFFTLSPNRTPGYYMGTKKQRSTSYYYGRLPEESPVTPGLSPMSAVYMAGGAVLTGLVMHMLKPEPHMIALDGSESPEAWREIIADRATRFRVHGVFSVVASGAQRTWKDQQEKYSIRDQQVAVSYWEEPTPVMTNVNMSRLVRLGYVVNPGLEIGLGLQADGIQRFYEEFHYARPGVPPQRFVRVLSQQANTVSIFATGQYLLARIPSLRTQLHGGAGVGVNLASVDLYGYATQSASIRPVDDVLPAAVFFASAEYHFDRTLSLGLTADFTYAGSLSIPAVNVLDYDNRVILTIDEHSIPLVSFGIGLSFSYGF